MVIYNEQGNVLENYDLTLGHIETHTRTVEHEAVEAVGEVSHYEVIATYPGGGKDVRKVVDFPGVPGREAWEEEIQYGVYIPYTAEELAQMNQPTLDDIINALLGVTE